jgi:hypothetical protein
MQNGVYRHYKGKLYYVVGVARQTETNEELVIYIPLYRHQDGGIPLQARPKTMFSGMVDLADGPAHRFTFIGAEIPKAGNNP